MIPFPITTEEILLITNAPPAIKVTLSGITTEKSVVPQFINASFPIDSRPFPNEIEEVAAMHENIVEAAAVGVPHEVSGEVVKLFVVRNNDSLTEKDVIAHCRSELTGYKVPKQVVFKDDLPKTNVGKILRRELRD